MRFFVALFPLADVLSIASAAAIDGKDVVSTSVLVPEDGVTQKGAKLSPQNLLYACDEENFTGVCWELTADLDNRCYNIAAHVDNKISSIRLVYGSVFCWLHSEPGCSGAGNIGQLSYLTNPLSNLGHLNNDISSLSCSYDGDH
ncbi:hypothetical protein BDV98DRAFT_574833 [Pterulicium gracile]|uniref:Uncharacterized protein n=1 Tax=Pterulicium gracile TaxID=1884261 RepID=A0A5C3Q5J2_9AGAR|nr:hypothetical protein BDV98DRAFT_574833 [Pterula gracilis]